MKLYAADVEISAFPPRGGWMAPGVVPAGVRVEHKPTGSAVEVKHYRSQHKNKAAALAVLELLIEDAEAPSALKPEWV